ncbi:MAG: PEP-CTERM sorting domain-containing protein [Pirellulales bacterium]|nr:PEP-CTERM sorting domain-containing protein [Pirellulales bacterium]
MKSFKIARLVLVISMLVTCSVAGASVVVSPVFMDLGDLPGGFFSTGVAGISGNGQVAVGRSRSDFSEAFRWTAATGMVGLGDLPGSTQNSTAYAASYDGSTIVGVSFSDLGSEPFRWTQAEGMVGLGVRGSALGVSADGSVIVGFHNIENDPLGKAFRWTVSDGIQDLGALRGPQSWANDVSADGSVIVGYSGEGDDVQYEAFVWTAETGMVSLDDELGGNYQNNAMAVSADGSVVVGSYGSDAFAWSLDSGRIDLGSMPDVIYADARDVSADGSVIVGMAETPDRHEPFLWNAEDGMRFLSDILTDDYGVDLTGWELQYVHGLSDDGKIIVGTGLNPAGHIASWIAIVPEPGTTSLLMGALAGLVFLRRRRTR